MATMMDILTGGRTSATMAAPDDDGYWPLEAMK